jgi:hypothetical protein
MPELDMSKEKELFVDMVERHVDLQDPGEANRVIEVLQEDQRVVDLYAREREGILRMRRVWSRWLLMAIMLIVVFDIFLVIAIGTGFLLFPEGYFVPVFVSESLLKIFGLAVIVVKFLFNENSVSS